MRRILPREINNDLLCVARVHPVLKQSAGVGVGRALEQHAGARRERRAFLRIDDVHRIALLLVLDDQIASPIDHNGAFTERDLFGRIGRRLHLHDLLLGELLEILPAEHLRRLVRRIHDRAAICRVRLHHLAGPLRVEQVGEAFRRVFFLHQIGVVADWRHQHARHDLEAFRIVVGLRVILHHLFRQIRHDHSIALPVDDVREIGRVGDVHRKDVTRMLLRDTREHTLGAGAVDPSRDPWKRRLEGSAEALRERQIHRGVERDLALLLCGFDQFGRDRRCGGRLRADRRGKDHATHAGSGQRSRPLQNVATRKFLLRHGPVLTL